MKIPGVRSSDDDLVAVQGNRAANLLLGRLDYLARNEAEARREMEYSMKATERRNNSKKRVADKHVMLSYCWNDKANPHLVKVFGKALALSLSCFLMYSSLISHSLLLLIYFSSLLLL
jgi:hypothetical protein